MPRACQHCESVNLKKVGRRMPHPVPSLVQIFGLFFALTYGESRRRIFHCEDCGKTTDFHTVVSGLFWIIYSLQLAVLAGLGVLIAWLMVVAILQA